MWLIVDAFRRLTLQYFLFTPSEEDSYQLSNLERLVSSLLFPNSTFPYLLDVTTYCCWEPGHIGHPPWVEESRKDSQTAGMQLHSVVDTWPKEISCLHGNIKGRRADSLLLHPVYFFPAGGEGGGWREMHARKRVNFIKCATQETSNERLESQALFLGASRVSKSCCLGSSVTWPRKEASPHPADKSLKWWFLPWLLPYLI